MAMRYAVTGARGYIGGRLVQRLRELSSEVVGTSRSAPREPPGWPAGAQLLRLDPMDEPQTQADVLRGTDCVVHLAAANEIVSAADPESSILQTGIGTRRVLEAAIAAGVRRFVFLSTIHVYGSPLSGRLDEASLPRPVHPYALGHRLGEDFVLAAYDAGRIEGVVVRLSNAIGAPAWLEVDRWSLLGNDLARQAVREGVMTLKAPYQWREFITLSEVSDGLIALAEAPADHLGDGVFNLGGGRLLRVVDVAERLADALRTTGRSAEIVMPEARPGDNRPPFEFPLNRVQQQTGFTLTGDGGLTSELVATVQRLLA